MNKTKDIIKNLLLDFYKDRYILNEKMLPVDDISISNKGVTFELNNDGHADFFTVGF